MHRRAAAGWCSAGRRCPWPKTAMARTARIKVRRGADDRGVVAAQLQQRPREPGRRAADPPRGPRSPSSRWPRPAPPSDGPPAPHRARARRSAGRATRLARRRNHRAAARANAARTASAVSGVFSDGFQDDGVAADEEASAAFRGPDRDREVERADPRPPRRADARVSIMRWLGRSLAIVRPNSSARPASTA